MSRESKAKWHHVIINMAMGLVWSLFIFIPYFDSKYIHICRFANKNFGN